MTSPLSSTTNDRLPRAGLWLFACLVVVRTLQSVACLVDPRGIAASADGIPLDRYPAAAAKTIAALFALNSYGRLLLCLLAVLVLLRMRALAPWLMGVFLVDQLGRRALLSVFPIESVGHPPGDVVSWGMIAINVVALVIVLSRPRSAGGKTNLTPKVE